jgi:fatty-acyl-CoA synthase
MTFSSPITLEDAVTLLEQASDANLTIDDGISAVPTSWKEIGRRSQGAAAWLTSETPKGGCSAILGGASIPTITAILGSIIAGRSITILPLPSSEATLPSLARRLELAAVDSVLVDPSLATYRPALERIAKVNVHLLDPDRDAASSHIPSGATSATVALKQFTSGTTGEPRVLTITHGHIIENLRAIRQRTGFRESEECLISWLPLSHDMGLIGFLLQAVVTQAPLVLSDPSVFLRFPLRWMENISTFGGTISAGPNFAYARLARFLPRAAETFDLSTWRLALNGGEVVRPDVCVAFSDAARSHGFRSEAVCPAYGLGEATLAVTLPEPGSGLAVDTISIRALENGLGTPCREGVDHARQIAVLGRPLEGLTIGIVGPRDLSPLHERVVGEVLVSGPSVVGSDGAPSEAGSCLTGDLGYLRDGELVICGRLAETINVAGRSILPTEVEDAVLQLPGARAGRVVAVSMPGRETEDIGIVAEGDLDAAVVRSAVRNAIGVTPRVVRIVEAGRIPKTTSGKVQRSLCGAQLAAGAFDGPTI